MRAFFAALVGPWGRLGAPLESPWGRLGQPPEVKVAQNAIGVIKIEGSPIVSSNTRNGTYKKRRAGTQKDADARKRASFLMTPIAFWST